MASLLKTVLLCSNTQAQTIGLTYFNDKHSKISLGHSGGDTLYPLATGTLEEVTDSATGLINQTIELHTTDLDVQHQHAFLADLAANNLSAFVVDADNNVKVLSGLNFSGFSEVKSDVVQIRVHATATVAAPVAGVISNVPNFSAVAAPDAGTPVLRPTSTTSNITVVSSATSSASSVGSSYYSGNNSGIGTVQLITPSLTIKLSAPTAAGTNNLSVQITMDSGHVIDTTVKYGVVSPQSYSNNYATRVSDAFGSGVVGMNQAFTVQMGSNNLSALQNLNVPSFPCYLIVSGSSTTGDCQFVLPLNQQSDLDEIIANGYIGNTILSSVQVNNAVPFFQFQFAKYSSNDVRASVLAYTGVASSQLYFHPNHAQPYSFAVVLRFQNDNGSVVLATYTQCMSAYLTPNIWNTGAVGRFLPLPLNMIASLTVDNANPINTGILIVDVTNEFNGQSNSISELIDYTEVINLASTVNYHMVAFS